MPPLRGAIAFFTLHFRGDHVFVPGFRPFATWGITWSRSGATGVCFPQYWHHVRRGVDVCPKWASSRRINRLRRLRSTIRDADASTVACALSGRPSVLGQHQPVVKSVETVSGGVNGPRRPRVKQTESATRRRDVYGDPRPVQHQHVTVQQVAVQSVIHQWPHNRPDRGKY